MNPKIQVGLRKERDRNGEDGHCSLPAPTRPFFPSKLDCKAHWHVSSSSASTEHVKASSGAPPAGHSSFMEERVDSAFVMEDDSGKHLLV